MNIFGIHLDPPFTRIALLKKKGKELDFSFVKEGESLSGNTVSAISASQFLLHSTELNTMGSKHLDEAIAFQSESTHHFVPEEILTVALIQNRTKLKTEALVFTVLKSGLQQHLDELLQKGIAPDTVSTTACALTHFIRWKFPQVMNAFVVDLGSSETSCVLIKEGKLAKAHAIDIGVEQLLGALLEDRKRILLKKEIEGTAKQIDLLLLKPGLNPHLSSLLSLLRQKINQTFAAYTKDLNLSVIFTGRTDAFIHLKEFIIENSEPGLTELEQKYAISMGLCLEKTNNGLQLLCQEFFPQKNWKQLGLFATLLFGASIALSCTLLALGFMADSKQQKEMIESAHLSQGESIDSWIANIEKNNKEYPYICLAPKVSETLGYISNHPLLTELKNQGDPIDIKTLRYQLVSMPKVTNPKEKYLAKLEIEFRFNNGINARKFHEALLKGDDWVNPEEKISWDTLGDGYRTELYLKNRRPYVP